MHEQFYGDKSVPVPVRSLDMEDMRKEVKAFREKLEAFHKAHKGSSYSKLGFTGNLEIFFLEDDTDCAMNALDELTWAIDQF